MIPRFPHWRQETRTSFWFVPTMIVLGAVALAAGLIAVDTSVDLHVDEQWPLIFGSGAACSRGLLLIAAVADRTISSPHDGAVVKAASVRLAQVLDVPPGGSPVRPLEPNETGRRARPRSRILTPLAFHWQPAGIETSIPGRHRSGSR